MRRAVLIVSWTNLGCSVRGSNRSAMISLSTFVSVVLLVVAAASSPTPVTSASGTESTSHVKLNHLAKSRGKLYLGTATDNGELTDKPYTTILDDNTMFGQITPANSMKWVSLSSPSGIACIHNFAGVYRTRARTFQFYWRRRHRQPCET